PTRRSSDLQPSKKASRVYAAKREPWLERLPRPLMGRTCMMSSEYCMDMQYRFGAQNASHSDDKKCAQLTSAIRTAATSKIHSTYFFMAASKSSLICRRLFRPPPITYHPLGSR